VEDRDTRVKRLKMRSMRRGIREMDMILIAFSETALDGMSDDDLAQYDVLLCENDHDLYQWITGQGTPPSELAPLVQRIVIMANGLIRPA
jgi:antitoxin CptB